MLRQQIIDQLNQALKTRAVLRLSILRFVLSEIKNQEIDKKAELTDAEVVSLLQKEAKHRSEAIADFKRGRRDDLVANEESKLLVIKEFLPQPLASDKLNQLINQVINESTETNFGPIMAKVMPKVKGRAEGQLVARLVKQKLASLS